MSGDTLNSLSGIDVAALQRDHPEAYGLAPAAKEAEGAGGAAVDDKGGAAAGGDAAAVVDEKAGKTEGEGGAAVVVDEKAGAAAGEGQVAAVAAGDKDGASKPMIPKARFDEVLVENKTTVAALAAREVELAETQKRVAELEAKLNPKVERDFDKEHADLAKQLDDGDLDLDEFRTKQRALQKEEISLTATSIADQRIAEQARQDAAIAAETAFKSADTAWSVANAAFLEQPGAKAAMQTALDVVDKQNDFKLAPSELFDRAGKVAAALIGAAAPATAGGGKGADDGKAGDAATAAAAAIAARNASDARAQAVASNTPPVLNGGMGDRGAQGVPDMTNLKQGEFGKLSKADQERALGVNAG